MKSRETKARDLAALTESLQEAKSAMIVSFNGLTVPKDQEFRNRIREAGAKYQVVKNTLARIAVKGTDYEQATEHFKGVTAIAWTDSDPVVLSKAIAKFMKDNSDHYTFKTGVVDGKLLDLAQVTEIASLPSKEELISKLLFVLNAQAQRIVTVINAVPRDLAVVIKQIGDKVPEAPAEEPAPAEEAAPAEAAAPAEEAAPAPEAETTPAAEAAALAEEAAPAAEAPAAETEAPAEQAAPEADATVDAPAGEAEAPAVEAQDGGSSEDAPTEAAEDSQETREDEQDMTSPEGDKPDESDIGAPVDADPDEKKGDEKSE